MARLIQVGEFASTGEQRAAEVLSLLPDSWTVIANKILPTNNGRSFEIDFIVLGDHIVFAIDEKSWRGRIHGSDAVWVRDDGSSERSPLNKIDYVAKILASHLRARVARFRELAGHPVIGCVLLSSTTEKPILRDARAADNVILLDQAVEVLARRDRSDGDQPVASLRQQIENALYDLSHRPKFPREVGPYTIVEVLSSGPTGNYRLRATHQEGGERLLRMYTVTGAPNDLKEFYLREYRVLRDLRATGVVPEVFDTFEWSEDFLVVPVAFPAGLSLSATPPPRDGVSALLELRLAAAAFRALERVHAAGVVHRALSPDTIYVINPSTEPRIMFTDFFAARRDEATIHRYLDDQLVEDPYAAPEITTLGSYGFASPASDTYSLALSFLERLSGVPVARLVDERQVSIPDANSGWPYLPENIAAALTKFFKSVLSPGPLAKSDLPEARRPEAAEAAMVFEDLVKQLSIDNSIEPSKLLDNRYRVVRVLGTGASARTLLATDTEADGLFALKQFLRPTSVAGVSEARREFDLLRNYPHPNLPRVYDVYPPSNDVHVKLEYIEGMRLTDIVDQYVGNAEFGRRLAVGLFDAIGHLERHGLLHRDLKPDNVIVRERNDQVVLIDFGSAAPAGQAFELSGTPGYLPPEAYSCDAPPSSTDRYALAVVLYRAMFGSSPFTDGSNPLAPVLVNDLETIPTTSRALAQALRRALAREPEERYATIDEFREAVLLAFGTSNTGQVDTSLPDLINPTVNDLRRLFRNSASGNADNRGLDSDFARETYVDTALDTRLLPEVLTKRPRAVFLSGNPGDGKTAFLERVREALRAQGGVAISEDVSGWEWQLNAHTFRACYDASEANGNMSADQQLRVRLAGLGGESPARYDLTVLVAINDGRLADLTERHAIEFDWLTRAVQQQSVHATPLDASDVWVVDLKRRAYVGLPHDEAPSVMQRIVDTMVAARRWNVCDGCAARGVCPIRRNAAQLRETRAPDGLGAGPAPPRERLERLLLLAHLRGQRHLTIRDLRSGLAYLITGDLSCEQVHASRHDVGAAPAGDYWRLAFSTPAERDIMLGELLPFDPARYAQPRLERYLFFRRDMGDAEERARLFSDNTDLPSTDDTHEWLGAMKRRLYFESSDASSADASKDHADEPWEALLPLHHAARFLSALTENEPPGELLQAILRGLGRSDGLGGLALAAGLSLRVAHSDENRLTVLKRFPPDQFALRRRARPPDELVEGFPETLLLQHWPTGAVLELTLDHFDLLLRLADGLEPDSPELVPLLEDLAPFKSRVQLSNSTDLILVQGGHRFHELTQEEGKVVRRAATTAGARA